MRDENDVNDYAAKDEQSSEIKSPNTASSRDNQKTGDTPTDSLNENHDSTGNSPKRGEDNFVPGILDNVNTSENEKENEASSPKGGKYNLRSNPTPNYTDEYRY